MSSPGEALGRAYGLWQHLFGLPLGMLGGQWLARALGALACASERHIVGVQEPAYGKCRVKWRHWVTTRRPGIVAAAGCGAGYDPSEFDH
jgi:hypothetical protein